MNFKSVVYISNLTNIILYLVFLIYEFTINRFDTYDDEVEKLYGKQYHRVITVECVSSANPKLTFATPSGKVKVWLESPVIAK